MSLNLSKSQWIFDNLTKSWWNVVILTKSLTIFVNLKNLCHFVKTSDLCNHRHVVITSSYLRSPVILELDVKFPVKHRRYNRFSYRFRKTPFCKQKYWAIETSYEVHIELKLGARFYGLKGFSAARLAEIWSDIQNGTFPDFSELHGENEVSPCWVGFSLTLFLNVTASRGGLVKILQKLWGFHQNAWILSKMLIPYKMCKFSKHFQ